MKKKFLQVCLLVLIVVSILTACSDEMSHGNITDRSYKNDWIGVNITIPDGWKFLTRDEIYQKLGVNPEPDTDENADTAMSYEFIAESETGEQNIILTIENLTATEGAKKFGAGDYLDFLASGLTASTDVQFTAVRGNKIKIAGKNYETLNVLGVYSTAMISKKYYARKIGDYMVCLICTDNNSDMKTTDEIISNIV